MKRINMYLMQNIIKLMKEKQSTEGENAKVHCSNVEKWLIDILKEENDEKRYD